MKKKYYISVKDKNGRYTKQDVKSYNLGGFGGFGDIFKNLNQTLFNKIDPSILPKDPTIPGVAQEEDEETKPKTQFSTGLAAANAMQSFGDLKQEDGKIDGADLGQTAGDFISGGSQYGQLGKQVGNIATGIIGQDATTNTLGEGVEYQKNGITAMNKALEYGATGAQYGGPIGAAAGVVIGGAMGLIQGNKRKKAAMKEFMKRRGERIDNFDEQSKLQYADQYLNQALYAKKGGKTLINSDSNNKGLFTNWCKDQGFNSVTSKCIDKGIKSKNAITRKRAVFAKNAREFNK